MATGKKPSAAQLRARANFIKMVKERARLRAAGKLPPVQRKAKAAKVKRKVGKPSPAQLAARAKFVAMVRAKAKAGKKNGRGFSTAPPSWVKGTKKKIIANSKPKQTMWLHTSHSTKGGARQEKKRLSTAYFNAGKRASREGNWSLGTRAFDTVFGKSIWTVDKRIGFGKGDAKKSFLAGFGKKNPAILRLTEAQAKAYSGKIKGLSGPARTTRTRTVSSAPRKKAGKKFKKVGIFGGSGFLGLGRSVQRIKANAKKKNSKRVTRERKVTRARRQQIVYRRQHGTPAKGGFKWNPSPTNVFTEFRGKDVTRKTKVKAASGTPSTLAQLGKLRELKLRGKVLKFRAGHLAADGRKKLHIVGIKAKHRNNPGGEVDYGEIISITYEADKPHVEEGIFNYQHKFGEEGGTRPHLIVDPEGFMKIEGGSYGITADGIID